VEMKDIIEKVNFYARLSKKRKLSEEEIKDREVYRKLYLEQFKNQVKNHLESIEIVDEKDFKN
jgi:asparagine--tRNA ligase